jgi:hypothetical protein
MSSLLICYLVFVAISLIWLIISVATLASDLTRAIGRLPTRKPRSDAGLRRHTRSKAPTSSGSPSTSSPGTARSSFGPTDPTGNGINSALQPAREDYSMSLSGTDPMSNTDYGRGSEP